jgi:hypothetical protein
MPERIYDEFDGNIQSTNNTETEEDPIKYIDQDELL